MWTRTPTPKADGVCSCFSEAPVDSVLKGIYVLVIRVREETVAEVGALGRLTFKKGLYAYVGSAQTNLEKRVQRHLGREKRKFWHIDCLLDSGAAKVVKALYRQSGKAEECRIASEIGKRGEATIGFGCSDCHCRSHLFRIDNSDFLLDSMRVLHVET